MSAANPSALEAAGHSPHRDAPIASPARRRIAIVHDWLCGYRGGEAVLDRIARLVVAEHECAGLWTMVDDGRPLTPTIDALPKHTSVLQQIPGGPTRLRRWLLPVYPTAVESLSRSLAREHARQPIDLVISTSSAAVKGIRPPKDAAGRTVPHVCYCHSPARYLWSQQAAYGARNDAEGDRGTTTTPGLQDRLRGAGLSIFGERLRQWDARTASNVSQFLANSSHTREEIQRCYGRDAAVIFPPVRTEFFTPDASAKRESFWLYVGALEPYKRADLAIDAANRMKHPLVIAGSGSSRASLEQRAGTTVRFEGRVGDERLRTLYRTARVLLFPQIEDFGIVAAEAQACGLPVVARGHGGALDTVVDGVTGVLFANPSSDSLLDAIMRFDSLAPAPFDWTTACRQNAERFSEAAFDRDMRRWTEAMLTR